MAAIGTMIIRADATLRLIKMSLYSPDFTKDGLNYHYPFLPQAVAEILQGNPMYNPKKTGNYCYWI